MSDLETMIQSHIDEKVKEKMVDINRSSHSELRDIVNHIKDTKYAYKSNMDDLVEDGLSVNSIEAEGAYRGILLLISELNSWILPEEFKIT